jgi:hypothetical protein
MLHPTTLTGIVQGTAWDGKLVRVLDEYDIIIKGETKTAKRYWACWFSEPQDVITGQAIQLVGIVSARLGEKDRTNQQGQPFKATVIEWHLNDCRVEQNINGQVIAVGRYDEEMPF